MNINYDMVAKTEIWKLWPRTTVKNC